MIRRPAQRGVALLAVLWVMALLAVIAAAFTTARRADTRLARNLADNARAEALADAGIHAAIFGLRQTGDFAWTADGRTYSLLLDGGEVQVSAQDEAGKFDLNTGSRDLLTRLLAHMALEPSSSTAVLDAVDDWRDEDALHRPHGAEDADYRAAGLPYGAKDGAFESVEELRYVRGVDAILYRRLAPLLTVHSRRRHVDSATAPSALRAALPGDVSAPAAAGLRGRQRVFTLHAVAVTAEGARFARRAVVRLASDPAHPVAVLEWHRLSGDAATKADQSSSSR